MAIRVTDEFGSRANSPDASYPDGSLKNETNPGVSNDGSPLDQRVGNDWEGFKQSALSEGGVAANGNPDSVTNPQILDALKKVQENHAATYTVIVYKASGGKSAVENMITGANVGENCKCENGSEFERISTNGNIDDFKPMGDIFALDFGADITGVDDFSSSFIQMIAIANQYNVEVDLGQVGVISSNVEATAEGITIKGGKNLILKGGTTTALTLHGNGNICKGFKVEDTNRNTQTLWLHGDDCLADSITAYNSTKSTSPTALFGDLIRISGNNSGARWCETYNGHTGAKLDNGDNPTERSYGQFLYQCRSHDNIRGGVVKPECADYNISQSYFNDNDVNNEQGSDGLLCERNSTGASITSCRFHRNGEHGLYGQFDNSIIEGNFANDNHGSGLKFGGKKSGNFNDSNPPISDAEFNAQYISENNQITTNICRRNGVTGTSNAGIYLQETHRGYVVSENECHDNLYGIRAVNQDLGGEIDNLSLLSNYCLNNINTDMTLSVKSECEIIGGNYGSITTFMNSDVFNDLTMKSLKINTLTTAAVRELKLRDVDITTQFTPSSANSISIGAGCTIHSSGDLNIRNVTEVLSSTIKFDTNGSLTASSAAKLERMNDVTIEAYNNTSIPYNLGDKEPDNINFDSVRIKTGATDVRAMVFNGNGHEISGVKSDNNAAKDILQINGDDCSMSLCTSTISKDARITMAGSGNIAVNNQATVLDATGSNQRFANRTQP